MESARAIFFPKKTLQAPGVGATIIAEWRRTLPV
jgi:hypothetical protein